MSGSLELREVDASLRPGVAIDAITHSKRQWNFANRRPPALTAREALVALQFEALFVWTVAHSIIECDDLLGEVDRDRLTLACQRIEAICQEVAR